MLRDYDTQIQHCNGINSIAIADARDGRDGGTCNLFTASRDRLIKLWNIDYASMVSGHAKGQEMRGCTLLADFDDHTDWVN